MRRALRIAVVVVSTLVVGASPARAKCGATILGLSVSGPGLADDIELSPEEWGFAPETHPATANALMGVGVGPEPASTGRPGEISDLGPRFTLRYEVVMLDRRARPAGNEVRIQYLFPYATGTYGDERAVAFTPRQMWEAGCGAGPERIAGPWWTTFPPDSVRRLEAFGLSDPVAVEASRTRPGWTRWPSAVAVAVGVVLLVGLAMRSRGRAGSARRSH